MTKKESKESCSTPPDSISSCCKVLAVVSVDERGQMVLPKEIRDKIQISAGDKLTIVSWEKEGKVCCISLIKVEDLAESVKSVFGPILKEIL